MGNTKNEINAITNELTQVVNELNNIAGEIKCNFKGIGSENCARTLEEISNQYSYVIRKMNIIDEHKLTEGYGGTENG